jgi:hypothetical protein
LRRSKLLQRRPLWGTPTPTLPLTPFPPPHLLQELASSLPPCPDTILALALTAGSPSVTGSASVGRCEVHCELWPATVSPGVGGGQGSVGPVPPQLRGSPFFTRLHTQATIFNKMFQEVLAEGAKGTWVGPTELARTHAGCRLQLALTLAPPSPNCGLNGTASAPCKSVPAPPTPPRHVWMYVCVCFVQVQSILMSQDHKDPDPPDLRPTPLPGLPSRAPSPCHCQ